MELHITEVPAWISISFALFFITIPVWLIAHAVYTTLESAQVDHAKKVRGNIILFYLLYFLVVGLVSLSGFFEVNTSPPRIIATTAIPLFLFYVLVVQRQHWFKVLMTHINLDQLVFLHVFRFVGIYFFLVYSYGSLPENFASIGGSGDILTAVLVFPVIYLIRRQARIARAAVWIWNIIGLTDIISVLISAIVITRQAIAQNEEGVLEFATFPFSWIPAFAPATIIFLHLLVFKKLMASQNS